ncbi:plexin domain-containing protein 2-like [Cloeon dipterum]|uniref:plexin domain-containing protein 2-like n=1 Tax=Cloeon dipterum TaxID=197152 RepID=UPI0032209453
MTRVAQRKFLRMLWIFLISLLAILPKAFCKPGNSRGTPPPIIPSSSMKLENHFHDFYMSNFVTDKELAENMWLDIPAEDNNRNSIDLNRQDCSHPDCFSKVVLLPFDFPFYGHSVREVVVMKDGYINIVMDRSHPEAYIAPLKVPNFLTNEKSSVSWIVQEKSLIVQWENLDTNLQVGTFSFQAKLTHEGRMIFFYKKIPIDISLFTYMKRGHVHIGLKHVRDLIHEDNSVEETWIYHDIYFSNHYSIFNFRTFSTLVLMPITRCDLYEDEKHCMAAAKHLKCKWSYKMELCKDVNPQEPVKPSLPVDHPSSRLVRDDQKMLPKEKIENIIAGHQPEEIIVVFEETVHNKTSKCYTSGNCQFWIVVTVISSVVIIFSIFSHISCYRPKIEKTWPKKLKTLSFGDKKIRLIVDSGLDYESN